MEGRDAEAILINEQALAKAPTNPVVLNNLAVLLSEQPGRAAEAMGYMNHAITAVPNSLELLDSKALVLMANLQFVEAREILERLCRSNPKNSRYRLHLSGALHALNEFDKSHEQRDEARRAGIDQELLTPSERRLLQKISD